MLRRLQLIALVLGLAFFAFLIHRIGIGEIAANLGAIGWGLTVVILLELTVDAFNTVGWRFTFPRHERHVSFASLFLVRLAGTAFNQALPSATVGGEPLKAMLLRPHLPFSSALASVVSAKLTYSIAQAILALAGLLLAFSRLNLPPVVRQALVASLLVTVAALGLFFWVQRRGLFATTAGVARRLRLPERWVETMMRATSTLDAHIRDFHALRPADFMLSVAWHLAGLGVGVLQIYLLLRWLGLPADAVSCVAIEAFSVLVQLTTFLVPGSIGVQEGGKVLIFTALGLPATAGLAVGIAFRLTQLFGIAAGLSAAAFLQWRQRATLARRVSPLVSG